jgi:hypothetical protein
MITTWIPAFAGMTEVCGLCLAATAPTRRRLAAAALSLVTLGAGSLAIGAEGAAMTVLAAPLPGPIARLATGERCASDPSTLQRTRVVVLLRDGRGFLVDVDGRSVHLRALPACLADPSSDHSGMLPGTWPQRGSGELREVWLAEPTERYRHAIFERPENAASIRALTASGRVMQYSAPPDAVIEDRLPRLVKAWGQDAVLTVQSSASGGAAVLVLGIAGGRLQPLAGSAPIGTPQRWLNPIGAADFDGDGEVEIAAVVTPHIGGWLTLYRRAAGRLTIVRREPGFSNHAIGTDELGLAAMIDANGDGVVDLAVPGADRRTLRIVTFAGGQFHELQRIGHSAPIGSAVIAADLNGNGQQELVYALADGTLVVLAANR